jgi:apolipoprotein N-acyltransferase
MKTTLDNGLALRANLGYALVAVAAFHIAYLVEQASAMMILFLYALVMMARSDSSRAAFYTGIATGLAIYSVHLGFFWRIFGPAALPLWLILSFWLGVFVLSAHLCWRRWGAPGLAILAPFLWTAVEYFRCELYYLRFSWLSVGFAFGHFENADRIMGLGVYAIGFLLMVAAAWTTLLPRYCRMATVLTLAVLVQLICFLPFNTTSKDTRMVPALHIAGIQAEFPAELEVTLLLDNALKKHPRANMFLMSEYTFEGPVPDRVKNWCHKHHKFLIVGGKKPLPNGDFMNTAFVISPGGKVVFEQGKSVPIQFFKDGIPAPAQKLWNSPWGWLGICICYDLSYRRVVDRLVAMGAQAIVVPTMDVADWGDYEHRLHARVGTARATEYGIPVFRLASSGYSQFIAGVCGLRTCAPSPGQGDTLYGVFELPRRGAVPVDGRLAPLSVGITILVLIYLAGTRLPLQRLLTTRALPTP